MPDDRPSASEGGALSGHDAIAKNRAAWDEVSEKYQAEHDEQLGGDEIVWGGWSIPERELEILGDVEGKDVLELGCGAAQFSIKLARNGARCVGVDTSRRQLDHAQLHQRDAGLSFPLVEASGTAVPLPDQSFDIVFSDHGAMTWADPYLTVPEAARLLRANGVLAFNMSSPLVNVCSLDEGATTSLQRPYFGMHRIDEEWGAVSYQLPYGEWIRLLRANGFEIEALVELRPPDGATTTYEGWVPLEWALQWPSENIWKARKRSTEA